MPDDATALIQTLLRDPEVVAAAIAAVASVLAMMVTMVYARLTAARKAEMEEAMRHRLALRNADIEYEFEAKKRLYTECYPLVFQLDEAAQRGYDRLSKLAERIADGRINDGQNSWLRINDRGGYFLYSTVYRTFLPIAAGRLLRRRLTSYDATLDPSIMLHFRIAEIMADTFANHRDLGRVPGYELGYGQAESAAVKPPSPAKNDKQGEQADLDDLDDDELERLTNPSTSVPTTGRKAAAKPKVKATAAPAPAQSAPPEDYEGVYRGAIERLAALLVVKDDGVDRLMELHEFEEEIGNRDAPLTRALAQVAPAFVGFMPTKRPIFWRVLIAQALLARALLELDKDTQDVKEIFRALDQEDAARYDWTDKSDDKELREIPKRHFMAAKAYVTDRLDDLDIDLRRR